MVSIAEGGMLEGSAVNGVLCHAEFLKWLDSYGEDVSRKVLISFTVYPTYETDQLLKMHFRLSNAVETG